MATSSYQTPNSYQELDFKPFQLDYSSILKEASAKTSYWMEGASKIQQAYSKLTNLSPTLIKNKTALNEFNNQVKDKIRKLAGTELGIDGNAAMINDIIAPIYDVNNEISESILTDDSFNKAGQSLLKTIEGYKTKDKGAHYSSNNEKYATEWYQKYKALANNPNASLNELRELKGEVKQYTPYYDYKDELTTAITKCPENSVTKAGQNGDYIVNVTSSTRQVGPCVQSFLSDKAKSQMQIDGYVEYGRNYSALGNQIALMTKPNIEKYSKELGLIALKLNDSKISDEERQAYEQQRSTIKLELNKLNNLTKSISEGDYSDIEKNYEQYAGMAYMHTKIENLNSAFSSTKDKSEIEADMVKLAYRKMQFEINEAEKERQFQREENAKKEANANYRAGLTKSKDKDEKELIPEQISTRAALGETDIKMDREKFFTEGKAIVDSMNQSELLMFNYISSTYGRNTKINLDNKVEAETYVKGLIATDPRVNQDPKVKAFQQEIDSKRMYYNLWATEDKRLSQKINEDIKKELSPVIVTTTDGKRYTVRPETFEKVFTFNNTSFPYVFAQGFINLYDINGKFLEKKQIQGNPNEISEIENKTTKKLSNIKNKYYETAITPNYMVISNNNRNVSKTDPIRLTLSTALSGIPSDAEGKKFISYDDVKIGNNTLTGDVDIVLPVTTADNVAAVTEAIRGQFKTDKIESLGNGRFRLYNVEAFKDPTSNDMYLETYISRMMSNIENTNYGLNEEISLLSNYKSKYEVYTKKSTPGIIYMRDKTNPNSTIVTETNVSKVVANLKQAK